MYLYFMDKTFDLMNPDSFSHFNGPFFSIIVGVAWGVATGRTNIVVTCDYFYGLEKLWNINFQKMLKIYHKVDSLSL